MSEVVNVGTGDPVTRQYDYVVDADGTYGLADLVPCRRIVDPSGSKTCAFLASTIVGIDLAEGSGE